MTELTETSNNIIQSHFRHNKHIGYKLKDFSESLLSFKKFFVENYTCQKTTLTSTDNETTIELIIDAEINDIIRVTVIDDHFSYIHSYNGHVIEAISGKLQELFPENYV